MQEITPTKDALEYLINTGKELGDIRIEQINGQTYAIMPGKLQRVELCDPARPGSREVYSLTGFADYIISDIDGHLSHHKKLMVKVISPTLVALDSPIYGVESKSDRLATCKAEMPRIEFDRYLPPDDFQIMLMTRFVQSENRDKVLAFAGKIRADESLETADDGFSQRVTIKTGAASNANVVIQNPVYLAPFRTFPEVTQPESPFVLRFGKEGYPALFEADGGAWRNDAVHYIAAWLAEKLPKDDSVQIIA